MSSTFVPTIKAPSSHVYPSTVTTHDKKGQVVLDVTWGSTCNGIPSALEQELRRLAALGFTCATRGEHAGRQRRVFRGKTRHLDALAIAEQLAANGYQRSWRLGGKLGRDLDRLGEELSMHFL